MSRLIIAASLPVIIQTASADVLLTDDFMVSSNSQNVNQQLAGRQTGPLAPAYYTGVQVNHQVGNTTTDVGQPGGATNGNYVLLAGDGCFFSNLALDALATGPLTIEFDLYVAGVNAGSTDPTTWVACCLTHPDPNDFFPVVPQAGEFGFLVRNNGGVQVFQNNGSITPNGFDTVGFAPSNHWTLIFSDSTGAGSAFNGNGSQVVMMNGTTVLGTIALSQLDSAGLRLGFRDTGNRYGGISNLKISGTPSGRAPAGRNLSFEYDTTLPGYAVQSIPTSWTAFNERNWADIGSQDAGGVDYTVFNPLAATATGNQFLYMNMFTGNPQGGIYQDMGPLATNSIYTLTVAIGSRADRINSPGIISLVNGTDNTGTVLATGGGLPSTQNTWQDYTATFTTGPTVSGDLTIVLTTLPAGTIQADFDNVRLSVQQLTFPPPFLISNTLPASATVAVGSNAVFTAAFSNSPPVTLQWQQIVSGSPNVTNNINTGVVTVTANGVETSTLTLNNVQMSAAGSYRLSAVNQAGTTVYTTPAPLTVIPTITWYAAGTYNSSFVDDTVLALAGSVANEVYGVDFGGSGPVTTDNGYAFNDYAGSGNMGVAGGGLLDFGGFEGGASTGDFNFDTILNNGISGTAANTGTLSNLTVGQTYTVLVLLDDTRTSGASGPNFDVTDGITVSPAQTFAFPNGTPAVGGFIMGTFTAQATTQPLTVLENGNAQYIAILLEKGIAPAPPIPPTLATDLTPPLLEVTTGGPVTLSVVGSGAAPLEYQWFNQSGPISGATNASYSFSAVAGTTSYQVVVTNSFGSVTSSVAEVISSTNIVTVNNFSFEEGTVPGPGGGTLPVLWNSFSNNNWCAVSTGTFSTIPDGTHFFALNEGPNDPTGGIYQDVGALLPNTTYTLTVAIGNSPSAPVSGQSTWSPGIISLINGTNNGGLVLARTNGLPATAGTWQDYSVTFITGPSVSGDLIVELAVAGAPTYQATFDNVRLTKTTAPAVVPPTLLTDINPLRSEVTTGTPWTLSVTVNGNPLHYQWYSGGSPISGANNTNYSFTAVAGTNSYQVIVTNSAGSVTSSVAGVISAPNLVTVNNFSFENGTTAGPGGGTLPVEWTSFNNNNWCAVSSGSFTAIPDGTYFFALNEGPSDPTGGIYQNVGALLPNTTYTLTVALGRNPAFGPGSGLGSPGIISLINGTSNTGMLLASTSGIPEAVNTWQDYAVSFSTGPSVSGDLIVELSVAGASTYQAEFDDVRLTTAGLFQFTSPRVSGGNLIVTGTGGPADGSYTLLTTTNLANPSSWTTYTTGPLDGSGAFSNSIPIGAAPARYFRAVHTP